MFLSRVFLLSCVIILSSCAVPIHRIQPQVNSLVSTSHFDSALRSLGNNPYVYGPKNELLYWLDKGLVLHLAGRYRESITAFERAKSKFDTLYTRSIREIASSYLLNDYRESYRGDDQEYVLVNVFQALNFAVLGQIHESLVEARQVDLKLKLINDRYGANYKNVYRDDAFARLLMGILYLADDSSNSIDDARISLDRSSNIYNNDYSKNFGIPVPGLLYHLKKPVEQSKATVYLIQYAGFIPNKIAQDFTIPAGGALMARITLPRYEDRYEMLKRSLFIAKGKYTDSVYPTDLGQDIGSIARQILEQRKLSIGAKALIRPAIKLAGEKVLAEQVRQKHGDLAALGVDILGSLYNFYSEQADLRGWETLPNQIRIARLVLEPGEYQFYVQNFDGSDTQLEKKDLGARNLKEGDVKFFIVCSYY